MVTGYNFKIKDPRLARYVPASWEHVDKYPLTRSTMPTTSTPVTCGVNWYANFDTPVKDKGKWWIGRGNLGSLRGGHCICMPHNNSDSVAWYKYYNQGQQGACVGFGSSRMMSLLNRKRYDARWLWDQAKSIDEWPETNPGDNEGTSVRAAMNVLRDKGLKQKGEPVLDEGISENRWATNIDQLFEVLQNDQYKKLGAIPFHNSWGKDYPKKVWMPCETWQRLMNEQGEFTMVIDRVKYITELEI